MSPNGASFRWLRFSFRALLTFVVLGGSLFLYQRWQYPFGWSHCCDDALALNLRQYAEAHGGRFPSGEATPEASLGLLYSAGLADANLLRGKTVPESVVQEVFDRGGSLGPDTCGWHYVEGLTLADDSRIALFWDKGGLGHNGQRQSSGRYVSFVSGARERILVEEWQAFLNDQRRLLAARTTRERQAIPALTARVQLPSGEVVDEYAAAYALHQARQYAGGSGSGSSSGGGLEPSVLRWWRFSTDGDVTMTYTLTLGPWRSQAVTVQVVDGVATPNEFTFVMSP